MNPKINEVIQELVMYEKIDEEAILDVMKYFPGLKYKQGAFKFCLFMANWDYVIKIDKPWECGSCSGDVKGYELAKQYNIEKLLLELIYVDKISSGQEIYIQFKADEIQYAVTDKKHDYYLRRTRNISDDLIYKILSEMYNPLCSGVWLKMMILCYGKKFVKSFIKWQVDTRQSDLHNANIGYLHDKPVIIDFGYVGQEVEN